MRIAYDYWQDQPDNCVAVSASRKKSSARSDISQRARALAVTPRTSSSGRETRANALRGEDGFAAGCHTFLAVQNVECALLRALQLQLFVILVGRIPYVVVWTCFQSLSLGEQRVNEALGGRYSKRCLHYGRAWDGRGPQTRCQRGYV